MKNKVFIGCLVVTGICATIVFIGSIGAYETGNIGWYEFFWRITSSILMYMLIVLLIFYRAMLTDYIEVCEELYEEIVEELDDYLIEEAEEVIIPEERFEFTRTPELED